MLRPVQLNTTWLSSRQVELPMSHCLTREELHHEEPNKWLLDEHPEAYKDIGEVMDNQRDLVKIEHRLETILNYKGS